MARRRYLKAAELEEILENWSDDEQEPITNVVLCAPEKVDELTDEEQFDENVMPNKKPANILEVSGYVEIEWDSIDEDFAAPAQDLSQTSFTSLQAFGHPKWYKGKLSSSEVFSYDKQPNHETLEALATTLVTQLENLSPTELFYQFFDEDVIQLLVTENNRYYDQSNNNGNVCNNDEMQRFLGILLLPGYSTVPAINDY